MITITKDLGNGWSVSSAGETGRDALDKLQDTCLTEWLGEKKCGACGCTDIVPNHRTPLDPKDKKGKNILNYYELKCRAKGCWAVLELGIKNDETGGLFPKRKDKEGNWLPNNGWTKKEFKKKEDE